VSCRSRVDGGCWSVRCGRRVVCLSRPTLFARVFTCLRQGPTSDQKAESAVPHGPRATHHCNCATDHNSTTTTSFFHVLAQIPYEITANQWLLKSYRRRSVRNCSRLSLSSSKLERFLYRLLAHTKIGRSGVPRSLLGRLVT
jgi:hypothetical protein